jgi:hypothetical protein
VREALLSAVATADRLVLLGDILELRERRLGEALAAAREPLAAIAAAVGESREIVLVAGNHDHGLVAPWLARRAPGMPLGVAAPVTPVPGEPLAAVIEVLGASRTTVSYPGAWLREDVWATHGHYADRHTTVPMLERLGAGVTAWAAGQRGDPSRPRSAEDYEASLAPMYAWIDALVQHGDGVRRGGSSAGIWRALSGSERRGPRRRALTAAFPVAIALLNRAGLGPLSADLQGAALRTGALRALGEVQRRLGVVAGHIVFGHTHRAGPLPGDDPAEWRTGSGARATRLVNAGCWVRERVLAGPDPARSPYRPGFAVWIDSDAARPPELVDLLD